MYNAWIEAILEVVLLLGLWFAISVIKSLVFVMYSRLVVDNPLSPVAPPTYVIDTFVWSIPK
jgi:hypothetical protein